MFLKFTENSIEKIKIDEIDSNSLCAGYIGADELAQVRERFGFPTALAESASRMKGNFRSGVEVYDGCTFTELRVVNTLDPDAKDDLMAIYISKNLLILVDVEDFDGSTKSKYIASLEKHNLATVTLEKLIVSFLDSLVSSDTIFLEDTSNVIADMEEELLEKESDANFSRRILEMKKTLLKIHNYYEQLIDITEALSDNENDIFPTDELMYVTNLQNKIIRLREDTDSLSRSLDHLQDAYTSMLDLKLNNHMKVFTVITTVFFPLTIIVGWYGMNFVSMPEFTWKYGYLYVILLSVVVIVPLIIYGKKKNWF